MTDDELIARHIAELGVTKCPTTFAAPTSAAVHPDDAAANRARGIDPVGDAWKAKQAQRKTGGWGRWWQRRRDAASREAASRSH